MPTDTPAATLPAAARAWTRAHLPGTRPETFESPGAAVSVHVPAGMRGMSHPETCAAMRPGAESVAAGIPAHLLAAFDLVAADPELYTGAPADVRSLPDIGGRVRESKRHARAYGLTWARCGDLLAYTDSYVALQVPVPDAWRLGQVHARPFGPHVLPVLATVPASMRRDLRVGVLQAGDLPGLRYTVSISYSQRAGLVLLQALPELDRLQGAVGTTLGMLEDIQPAYLAAPLAGALANARRGTLRGSASRPRTAVLQLQADDIGGNADVLVSPDLLACAAHLQDARVYSAGAIRPLELQDADSRVLVMPMRDNRDSLEMES